MILNTLIKIVSFFIELRSLLLNPGLYFWTFQPTGRFIININDTTTTAVVLCPEFNLEASGGSTDVQMESFVFPVIHFTNCNWIHFEIGMNR